MGIACAGGAAAGDEADLILAEARIGAELAKAHGRGEVATQERKTSTVRSSDGAPASHADIGIPRQRASEMKTLAEVGADRIREQVKRAQPKVDGGALRNS